MKQHTLVAFYGEKQNELKKLVQLIWDEINSSPLKLYFFPYDLPQIHSTIIGMEKIPGFPSPFNLNAWEKKGIQKQMDVEGLTRTLERFFPMTIQFGGFQEDFQEITSFGQSFFNRSFQIYWPSGKVVLVGGPMDAHGQITDALLSIREVLYQKHHILHKYQDDNDCYMVLGVIKGFKGLSTQAQQEFQSAQLQLEKKIRQYFADYPKQIQLNLDDLSVVEYTDTRLPFSSSQSWPLDQINELFK